MNGFGDTTSTHLTWKQPILGPMSVCQRLMPSRFTDACDFQHHWMVVADKRVSSGIFFHSPNWSPTNSFGWVDNTVTAITSQARSPPPITTTTLPVVMNTPKHLPPAHNPCSALQVYNGKDSRIVLSLSLGCIPAICQTPVPLSPRHLDHTR
jgi:hypothetical protein